MQRANIHIASIVTVIFCLVLYLKPINAQETDLPTIIYQAGEEIIQIHDGLTESIATGVNGPAIFSNDGNWIAYRDDKGVWISNFDALEFVLIHEDERKGGGLPFWTPDSSFLIFTINSLTPEGVSPQDIESFIYNNQTGQVSDWSWPICTSIIRDLETEQLALKCMSHMPNQGEYEAVGMYWGGKYQELVDSQYETVTTLTDLDLVISHTYDWDRIGDKEYLAYLRREDYEVLPSQGQPPQDIFIISGSNEPSALGSSPDAAPLNMLNASPDFSMIAYFVNCNNRRMLYCLQIVETSTSQVIWNAAQTVTVSFPIALEWSRDGRFVVILAYDQDFDTQITIFNTGTGEVAGYSAKDSVGNLVVR